jgi:glutathione synthase/RimK-type ligase-like ATP-grasp enzyme
MILVWGERDDPPVALVLDALVDRGARHLHIDQAALHRLKFDLRYGTRPQGWIELDGRRLTPEQISGWYLRPSQVATPQALRAAAVLMALAGQAKGNVLNPPAAAGSNGSKPYQLSLIAAAGWTVPETICTSSASAARAFLNRHGCVIYKSTSGVRSIVHRIDASDPGVAEAALSRLGHGPVQWQRWIAGIDWRVHVVGRRWFATEVRCDADDYRYAPRAGQEVMLRAGRLPRGLGERAVALARYLGLGLAGIDLRRTPQGDWVCFEVNPQPGFSYYEESTGQPIAEAVAALLDSRLAVVRRPVSARGQKQVDRAPMGRP